jgi:hypothetical protein
VVAEGAEGAAVVRVSAWRPRGGARPRPPRPA